VIPYTDWQQRLRFYYYANRGYRCHCVIDSLNVFLSSSEGRTNTVKTSMGDK